MELEIAQKAPCRASDHSHGNSSHVIRVIRCGRSCGPCGVERHRPTSRESTPHLSMKDQVATMVTMVTMVTMATIELPREGDKPPSHMQICRLRDETRRNPLRHRTLSEDDKGGKLVAFAGRATVPCRRSR